MNILLNLSLLVIGSLAGNLVFTGYLVYGIPLTIAGLLLALFLFRTERKEQQISRRLIDKQLY
jgi:hypothetical protein